MLKKRWVKITLLTVGIVIAFLVIAGLVCTQVCLNEDADLEIDGPVHQSWVQRYKGDYRGDFDMGRALDVAVSDNGYVYVTGEDRASQGNADYATIKYDADGNELWVARYDSGGNDLGRVLALDQGGNVYVTGTGGSACATIKYDVNGEQKWVARYPESGARAIAVDAQGNAYVAATVGGDSFSTHEFDTSFVTIKYDTDGNQLWAAIYDTTDRIDESRDIAIDESGNVYVTGYSNGRLDLPSFVTLKYDSTGKQLWVARYAPTGGLGEAWNVAVDQAGNVYVSGHMAIPKPPRFVGYAVVKYDSTGRQLWASRYEGEGGTAGIAVNATGDVYVVGGGYLGIDGSTTLKYDSIGNLLWAAKAKYESCDARAMILDSAGNVYVAGNRCSVIKYDPEGNQVWAAYYDLISPAGYNWGIAVDNSGKVYAAGDWDLGILSGADPFGHNQTVYYVAKYRQRK